MSDPAELHEDRVGRDERHRGGQEDRRDQQCEQQVPAAEPEAGKAVGDERARDNGADHADDCDQDRVQQQQRKVDELPDLGVVLPLRREGERWLERAPRARPGDQPGAGVGRIDELALLAALRDKRQLANGAVDREPGRRRSSGPRTRRSPGRMAGTASGAGSSARRFGSIVIALWSSGDRKATMIAIIASVRIVGACDRGGVARPSPASLDEAGRLADAADLVDGFHGCLTARRRSRPSAGRLGTARPSPGGQ